MNTAQGTVVAGRAVAHASARVALRPTQLVVRWVEVSWHAAPCRVFVQQDMRGSGWAEGARAPADTLLWSVVACTGNCACSALQGYCMSLHVSQWQ